MLLWFIRGLGKYEDFRLYPTLKLTWYTEQILAIITPMSNIKTNGIISMMTEQKRSPQKSLPKRRPIFFSIRDKEVARPLDKAFR